MIIEMLPKIFNGKIPNDILSKNETGILPQSYFEKILSFLEKDDIFITNNDKFYYWPQKIRKKLIELGY